MSAPEPAVKLQIERRSRTGYSWAWTKGASSARSRMMKFRSMERSSADPRLGYYKGRHAMSSPVDPNDVMMTGENSFIRFSTDGAKTFTDRTSHWRVLWCPAGAGHALFMTGTLTGGQ